MDQEQLRWAVRGVLARGPAGVLEIAAEVDADPADVQRVLEELKTEGKVGRRIFKMGEHQHRWDVVSTAVVPVQIIVECACGAQGVIANPSLEEWNRAYYGPSIPYEWDGGDERVRGVTGG